MTQAAKKLVVDMFETVLRETLGHFRQLDADAPEILIVRTPAASTHVLDKCDEVLARIELVGTDNTCSFSLLVAASAESVACFDELSTAKDWLGEFVNLVMGGVKNRIVEYGVNTQLLLPQTSEGIGPDELHADETETLIAELDGATFLVLVDLTIDPEVQWDPGTGRASLNAGEICWF